VKFYALARVKLCHRARAANSDDTVKRFDRSARLCKKLVAAGFGAAQLWWCQRAAHVCARTERQYSSANMIVITRWVIVGSAGSSEW
jgi:hypothetical protein